MTTTEPSSNVSRTTDVDRRRDERGPIGSEHAPSAVLLCDGHEVPVTVTQYSTRGICVQTEILDIAVFESDPVAAGDRLHVKFRGGLYEGIARHVTPTFGAIAVGIEWTPFTLCEKPLD